MLIKIKCPNILALIISFLLNLINNSWIWEIFDFTGLLLFQLMHVCHRGFPSLYIVFLYMAKNPCTHSSRPDWLEFRLERPVHTTQEKLNSVKMAPHYMSSRSSVDRAPARCSGGHGCDSCRGLRFVLCPTLLPCWSVHIVTWHLWRNLCLCVNVVRNAWCVFLPVGLDVKIDVFPAETNIIAK